MADINRSAQTGPVGGSTVPPGMESPEFAGLTTNDAEDLARGILDKIERQSTHRGIQFGTVVSVNAPLGAVPYARVQVDGDPQGNAISIPVVSGLLVYPGLRVAILWDNPHGCYVFGQLSASTVPHGRISTPCAQ